MYNKKHVLGRTQDCIERLNSMFNSSTTEQQEVISEAIQLLEILAAECEMQLKVVRRNTDKSPTIVVAMSRELSSTLIRALKVEHPHLVKKIAAEMKDYTWTTVVDLTEDEVNVIIDYADEVLSDLSNLVRRRRLQ